jgi:broad specificity phosphatase PhoE
MRSLEEAFLLGVDGVTEMWLVRHADCYHQMVEVDDPPLSSIGREQARRLGERLRATAYDALYSSPYRRALETARAIADHVRIDQRLVEMPLDIGDDLSLEFKETPESAAARMRAVLADLADSHPGGRVVVVSHAASIIAILTETLRLEPGQLRLLPYYTSISILRTLGGRSMIGSIGDTAHLD